jgi:hypothetical protein
VADESASNRYGFDELRLDPGRSVTLFSGCGTDDDARRYWCASGVPCGTTAATPCSSAIAGQHRGVGLVRRLALSINETA